VTDLLATRLQRLTADQNGGLFAGSRIGIEKECLRVAGDGTIARTRHPTALGSALEHRFITTDYSEALLEFVTPPVGSSWEATQFLCDLHQYAHAAVGDEILWPMSMPCRIESDTDVPIALYGSSNVGRMKNVYRRGLGYRYGRRMQAIAGIHFNYSPPAAFWPLYHALEGSQDELTQFRSAAYMSLVRNIRRFGWLLSYLMGASPAIAKPFPDMGHIGLKDLEEDTIYGPYATSLRMSDLGYQHSNQSTIRVSANSIDEYIDDLVRAVRTPSGDYEQIGVKQGDEYRQLNTSLLQIENEYYGTIRPKRVARSGERPTSALLRGGVEYVELRSLDISPFDPVGINQQQIRFLEAFLVFCLLEESPPIGEKEQLANSANHAAVAVEGRRPGLQLQCPDGAIDQTDWARRICTRILEVAELLDADRVNGTVAAVEAQMSAIDDPTLTPSARMIAELEDTGQSFLDYAMSIGREYADYFRAMDPELNANWQMLTDESHESLERQVATEAADTLSFDQYVEKYCA
jgi:glutamate--cysteine ligase